MANDRVIDSRGMSVEAMIRVQHAQHIQFIECGLRHAGGHGLWVDSGAAAKNSGMLQACEFEDLGASILRQDFGVSSQSASHEEGACGLETGEWGSRLLGPQVVNF